MSFLGLNALTGETMLASDSASVYSSASSSTAPAESLQPISRRPIQQDVTSTVNNRDL
jgi:hypothetical protein